MGSAGDPIRVVRTPLARVGLYALPAGYRMRRHVHEGAGLVLGLSGAWVGTLAPRHELACAGADVVVLPDGATHHERSPSGARCLLVTFEPGRRDLDGASLALLSRDRHLGAPAIGARGARALAAALDRGPGPDAAARLDLILTALLVDLTAGYRRRPEGRDARWLRTVREALDAASLDAVDLAALAGLAGRTREHVYRCFRDAFGVAPGQYVRARRLEQAARLLVESGRPVAAIAAECGFTDESHLARWFRARFGAAPGRFRRERGRARA